MAQEQPATDTKNDATNEAPKEKEKEEQKQQQQQSTGDKLKGAFSAFGQKAKETAIMAKDAASGRVTMEGQLKAARDSLSQFLSPELAVEKQIPLALMANAKAIVFLSCVKASFGIGASIGTGIIMAKLEYGAGWSGPCSLGQLGGQMGFNMGASKTDFIIILRDETALKVFSGQGQLKFGGDVSIAVGPVGRDAEVAVNANDKGYTATVSYSMSKGLYVGVALKGEGIVVREECNEKYYGKKVATKDILSNGSGNIENEDYDAIVKMMEDYTAKVDQMSAMEADDNLQDDNEQKANI